MAEIQSLGSTLSSSGRRTDLQRVSTTPGKNAIANNQEILPGVFPDLEERETFSSDFDAIKISIAAPEKIRAWSHGEVSKAETINYRTLKRRGGGLFCAKIFVPINDWECLCGKYKRMKHRGVVCDKCGVEVTQAAVRRSRLGHIELACPVSMSGSSKSRRVGSDRCFDPHATGTRRVLYYESYVVLDPGDVDMALLRERKTVLRCRRGRNSCSSSSLSPSKRPTTAARSERSGSVCFAEARWLLRIRDRLLKRLFGTHAQ